MALYLHVRRSPTGRRLLATDRFTPYDNQRLTNHDVIFTWGGDMIYERYNLNGAKHLNPNLCYDKAEQGRRILGAGVSLPKLYNSTREWERDGYPDLVKKPRNGQGGKGIVLCNRSNLPGWRSENIYQLFINKSREFRVQQIGEFSAYIMEKFRPAQGDGVCWNLDQGAEWHGLSRSGRLGTALTQIAYRTLQAMSYDFGAVDVMTDEQGQLYVLECNSRPGLGRENIALFADTMVRYYESIVRR
jgi:glutathione synthase/RimK-type ligase-like ATP-grasp enzyme